MGEFNQSYYNPDLTSSSYYIQQFWLRLTTKKQNILLTALLLLIILIMVLKQFFLKPLLKIFSKCCCKKKENALRASERQFVREPFLQFLRRADIEKQVKLLKYDRQSTKLQDVGYRDLILKKCVIFEAYLKQYQNQSGRIKLNGLFSYDIRMNDNYKGIFDIDSQIIWSDSSSPLGTHRSKPGSKIQARVQPDQEF